MADGGSTVVLVEQDLRRAMAVAGQIYCMLEGRIVLAGAAGALSREQITAAYFGLNRTDGDRVVIWVNAIIAGVLLGGLYALFACGLS